MSAVWNSARELWSLIVEDASFTIGIFGAVLIAAHGFPRMGIPRGALLFVLVVLVLIENVTKSARLAWPPAA